MLLQVALQDIGQLPYIGRARPKGSADYYPAVNGSGCPGAFGFHFD
jgi:hypothetical protein